MTTWQVVSNEDDIRLLMHSFDHFRNSILRECKYGSGIFVDESSRLHLGHRSFLRCLFQSQHSRLPAIELVFGNVQSLSVRPDSESAFEEAYVRIVNGQIEWTERQPGNDSLGNRIQAESLYWRPARFWLGKRERYSGVEPADLGYYDPEPDLGPTSAIMEPPSPI